MRGRWAYCVVPVAVWLHVLAAPYTKVEESFNMQAAHDIVYHKLALEKYDHNEFPGVVPRTFIGAVLVSAVAEPFVFMAKALGLSKLASQYIVRFILGTMASLSFVSVQRSISKRFGHLCGSCFAILLATQFHLPYYASRFLPNTYALILSNLALGCIIAEEHVQFSIWCLTFGCAIFRCDLCLLLIPAAIAQLVSGKIALGRLVVTGLVSTSVAVLLTCCVDSFFWGRPIWPELEVFLFNNPVDNRSAEWGVASPHWYFSSALPKALTGSLFFFAIGICRERRTWPLAVMALSYVLLYSLLPHKELRFLFPVLPYFTAVAAAGLDSVVKNRRKKGAGVLTLLSVAVVGLSVLYLLVSTLASSVNYPGGVAFRTLHDLTEEVARDKGKAQVHVDVLPAMTGVTRFGELHENWTYSKTEDLEMSEYEQRGFDYLLSSHPHVPGYVLWEQVEGFAGIRVPTSIRDIGDSLSVSKGLHLLLKTRPQVYIHRLSGGHD